MKFFHNKGNKFFFVFLVLEISFLIFQKYSGTLGKRVINFLSSTRFFHTFFSTLNFYKKTKEYFLTNLALH